MTSKKKRKRSTVERPTIHPRNKYSDNPPDFGLLASFYPTFEPFVFYSRDGRPRIDWTDFNATRELTRVLLLHDHALNWWIPDGQLCPTVPNRSNYIHWIEDILSSDILTNTNADGNGDIVRGFDIGTGANCIYPLLGASLLGWSFVGSDVTDVALEWAERNVKNNPQISDLIEIRKVDNGEERSNGQLVDGESGTHLYDIEAIKAEPAPLGSLKLHSDVNKSYHGPPVLLGVVRDGEKFDFCMCNPPFFETMEEAGLNPKTSCGGTPKEMVCPGGEEAFISRIIRDSLQLKQSFRWYTSLVGRKSNLKILISKLREVGVTIVKTTEFVQGRTCRWGLAWSFMPPSRKIISSHVAEKNVLSFTLEGLQRKYSAIHVLESVESFFCSAGASSKSNASAFTIDVCSFSFTM
ncbi:U6 small nuclear RNA (adenine-(43)-N(6))-methyltransferase-like [Camellia sinensis]|uniref:U6 small nuclear RNA (adenine-(43)-N(6))-methyltransferase-like n=1 Tax=Camellia sinensis TaxID=4442 RepID=UPI001036B4F9|nr:U6 small nuclear RNA (adenine-(43)-N(6))-methyltransferase-like [Camellia sinensis]